MTWRKHLPLAIIALLVALVPLSLFAAGPTFTDLEDAAPEHRADIQAIAGAGVTTGFDDPNAIDPNIRLYDPTGTVTRQEMASFLARLGGLGGNPAVANAATAGTATNAANADTVGFFAPSSLGRVYGQALGSNDAIGAGFLFNALQVEIPVAGYAAVTFTATVQSDGPGCVVSGRLQAATNGTLVEGPLVSTNVGTGAGQSSPQVLSSTWLVPVAPGGAYIGFQGGKGACVNDVRRASSSITAVFSPFSQPAPVVVEQP